MKKESVYLRQKRGLWYWCERESEKSSGCS